MPETRRLLLLRLEAEGSTARIQVVDSGATATLELPLA